MLLSVSVFDWTVWDERREGEREEGREREVKREGRRGGERRQKEG